MDIEKAKQVHSKVIGILLARQGIGEFVDADIAALKQTSLTDMLAANSMLDDYKEELPEGGYSSYVVTTEKSIAELYCRLQDNEFQTTDDLEDACSALDQLRDTGNGHGVLVDGYGNWSFIELNSQGDGADETVFQAMSASRLLMHIKTMADALDHDE